MLPSHECFGAADCSRFTEHLRLIVEHELTTLDPLPKLCLDRQPVRDAGVDRLGIQMEVPAALRTRCVLGRLCVAQ